jgi:hypothetical protein
LDEKAQWYTNQQLFEKMQELTKEIECLKIEMAQTTVLIRDYNGLRKKITDCENALRASLGKVEGGRDMYGYIVGAVSLMILAADRIF